MSALGNFKRWILGNPIASKHAHHHRLPVILALPVFASDALSSVAYASEEIMHTFRHNNALQFLQYTLNISVAIAILIAVVALSYFQTIFAYPGGGGSYLVAKHNLGIRYGMLAGTSLVIDYVLTVAVSTSAGVAALVSMSPSLQPYVVQICVGAIFVLTMANLRGAKESGLLFAIPTYTFIVLLLVLIVKGLATPAAPIPAIVQQARDSAAPITGFALIWLFMKSFAAGCTALTGIEAVANSTGAFKEPASKNASMTLVLMATILGTLFIGMSTLAERFHALPMEFSESGYKTVCAQIAAHALGPNSLLFNAIQIATAAILFLAANTAYADFPRVTSTLARDGFLPRQLNALGDRLVFQNGILLLAIAATVLVVAFKGNTTLLIPLYAVGVFICFTLSQFGMVSYLRQHKRPIYSIAVSFMGGIITATVLLVIFTTKFKQGAWLVFIAGTAILTIFTMIRRHYSYLAQELNVAPTDTMPNIKTTVILLIPRVHRGILHAIAYARAMAKDVRAVHVTLDKTNVERVKADWTRFSADMPLVILESPYRSLIDPIIAYVDQALAENPDHIVTVIVPQAVPKRWWQSILHTNAAVGLKLALGSRKNVVITNVRYFLK